jgi:hypothetical protein
MFRTTKCSSSGRLVSTVLWYVLLASIQAIWSMAEHVWYSYRFETLAVVTFTLIDIKFGVSCLCLHVLVYRIKHILPQISLGGRGVVYGGRFVWLTTSPPSCANCLEIWEPQLIEYQDLSRPIQGVAFLGFFYCLISEWDSCKIWRTKHVNFSCSLSDIPNL